MRGRRLMGLVAIVAGLAAPAAADRVSTERFRNAVPLAADGSLLIDNPIGAIVVTGTDRPGLRWEAIKSVHAVDDRALHEGRVETGLQLSGNERMRVLRTVVPYPLRNGRWESKVAYRVEIPSGVQLTIVNVSGELIRVSGLRGSLTIKNVNGMIQLDRIAAPVVVETVNGQIRASLPERPAHPWKLSSVNGTIELRAPSNAAFEWTAETIRGGIHTTFRLSGFQRRDPNLRQYWATIGRDSKVNVVTSSVLGNIYLVAEGTDVADAHPIFAAETDSRLARAGEAQQPQPLRPDVTPAFRQIASTVLIQRPSARSFVAQQARIAGDFTIDASIGSIFVGEVAGDAEAATRAGEIVLGRVGGRTDVRSLGGSLHLGDLAGPLQAHTAVGDIFVRSARRGGTAVTEGGSIHVGMTGAATSLRSDGGDIVVHRSGGPLEAKTRSGDVWIALDPGAARQRIHAVTESGNVILHVPSSFAADVDATVLTTEQGADAIVSDLPGLTIVRQPAGDKVTVRATGKLNGGGERVILRSNDGTIQIRTAPPLVAR